MHKYLKLNDMAKKNSSEEKEISKEQAILEAAEQEFMEKGFEATKTTKIASLAGVTHAMLHYYYRTKENLFNMVFDKKVRLLKDSIFSLFDKPDMPFFDKVRIGIETHFDFIRDNQHLPRFVINELIYKPKRLKMFEGVIKKVAGNAIEKISLEIEKEVKKGTIVPIDPVTLLLDVASLNVFVFAALPIVKILATEQYYESEDAFFEARKKENVEVIMRRIKK